MAKNELSHVTPINLLSGEPIMRMSQESGTIYDLRTLSHIHNSVLRRVEHEVVIGDAIDAGKDETRKEAFLQTVTVYAVRLYGELTRAVKIYGQHETTTLPLITLGESFHDMESLKQTELFGALSKKRRKTIKERLGVIQDFHDIERKMEQPDEEGKTVELKESDLENYDKALSRINSVVSEFSTANLVKADSDNAMVYDGGVWEVISEPFDSDSLPDPIRHFLMNAIWESLGDELGIITLVDDGGSETEPDDDTEIDKGTKEAAE